MLKLFRTIRDLAKAHLEARIGRVDARLAYLQQVAGVPTVTDALATIRHRWPAIGRSAAGERPIFILSTAWRSGSTLLQRLLMSDPSVLIWGEPYAHCDYIGTLAASLRIFSPEYPPEGWFDVRPSDDVQTPLNEKWIANLYPAPVDLLDAHRAFLTTLYADSARRWGYGRWGLKEVRLGIEEARYLKTLFPGGHFVVLHRSPVDAWRSYRLWRSWYYRWPSEPVLTPRDFGRHWARLAGGLLDGAEEIGATMMGYDDLAAGRTDLQELGRRLGVTLSSEALQHKISGRETDPGPVPAIELRILKSEVASVAARLGYDLER